MLLLALPMGVKPYLVGIVAVQLAALFVMIVWLCWLKALRSDGIAYAVVPPLVSAGAAYLACELARASLGADDSRFSTAVLYGTGFASYYVGALRLLFSRTLDEIVFYLPGRAAIGRILDLKSTA